MKKMNKYVYNKWTVRCSFCNQRGHNIRSCSDVPLAAKDSDHKRWNTFQVAIAQGELERRKQLANRSPIKRKKPHCSFCGAKKHNRKNCHKLKKMRKRLYAGNMRWRRRFIERVNTLGINEGALIETKGASDAMTLPHSRSASTHCHLGIVEPFDFDSLNVFCNFLGHWDYRSQSDVRAKLTTKKGFIQINLGRYIGEDLFYKNAFFSQYNSIRVLVRSQWENSKEWVEEKSIPPIEWLLKTHSLEELKDFQITAFIEKWT